jgi:GMP synthase-like glutamine amidotransferase
LLKTAHVIGPDYSVSRTFEEAGYSLRANPDDAAFLIWTGGEDINPALYGARPHPNSYWSNRDLREVDIYKKYEKSGRVFVGICRGAQLFCAMNGGELYQHVNNHGGGSSGHSCDYLNEHGEIETGHSVSSVHHQMCNPFTSKSPFEIWGMTRRATFRDKEERISAPLPDDAHPDIEIMWWPETKCYGFQGHPEYHNRRCTELFFRGLDRAAAGI